MKGLLLKDWYQVKTNMRMMYLTVLAVLAIWILSTSGDSSFAVNYSAVFLGMMPAYLLSYDHASGWTEYSFAVPEPGAAIAIVGVLAAVLVLYALSWRLSVQWYGKYKK